jgi:hypothetical protein
MFLPWVTVRDLSGGMMDPCRKTMSAKIHTIGGRDPGPPK